MLFDHFLKVLHLEDLGGGIDDLILNGWRACIFILNLKNDSRDVVELSFVVLFHPHFFRLLDFRVFVYLQFLRFLNDDDSVFFQIWLLSLALFVLFLSVWLLSLKILF